jgi:hypothetical protein
MLKFFSVIIGGTPGTVLYLCSYDIFKYYFQKFYDRKNESFSVHFLSGMLAESVACIIYVPVDVVKERMQVQSKGGALYYQSSWDALVSISKTEGLSGIYKGYGATLASFGPFSALYFVFYERFKQYAKKYLRPDDDLQSNDLPLQWIILSSAGAGGLASFLTSPLDMAKLRLQVQRGTITSGDKKFSSATTYRGMSDCLRHAYQLDGVRGLFRGAGVRVVHFIPATTITMTCYETCRTFIYKEKNEANS